MRREPLIQLKYRKSPWKLLVACVLLNRTRGTQAKPVIEELFRRWPTSKALSGADTDELTELIRPLGLQHQRALTLVYLSRGYGTRRGLMTRGQVKLLAGVGDYAADCYEMLVLGDLRVDPRDKELARWRRWAVQNPPRWAKRIPLSFSSHKIELIDGFTYTRPDDILNYLAHAMTDDLRKQRAAFKSMYLTTARMNGKTKAFNSLFTPASALWTP